MRNIYIWFFFYTTVEYERIIGYTKILRQYWGFFDWTHIICNYKHKTFTPLALVSISRPRKSKLRHPYQRHYRLDRPFTRTVAGVTNDVRKRGWTERGEWLSVHYFDHLFTLAVARVTTCRRGWTKEERKRKYQQEIPHDLSTRGQGSPSALRESYHVTRRRKPIQRTTTWRWAADVITADDTK